MQADSPPIRSGNQDVLYRPLGKIRLWVCTCKQEPPLYLRLSTKNGWILWKAWKLSSYKRLNSCFVAIASFHKVYYTSKGLTFFLKQVSRVFRKMGVVLRSKTLWGVKVVHIKTHGSVSCGPRSLGRAQTGVGILTGTTKLRFSRIHRSVTFYQKITKFAVELPAYNYKGRLDSKIEVNRARRFRDTRDQSFSFCSSFFFLLILLLLLLLLRLFAQIEKSAITCKCVLWSGWNLVHL